MTCGQDRLVKDNESICNTKIWDVTDPKLSKGTIVTDSPVWRARFTPFGKGILTMPQRKDKTLSLYSCSNLNTPIHAFVGHTDVPKEFVWRSLSDTEFQLVTWSKDRNLRIWPIEEELFLAIDQTAGFESFQNLSISEMDVEVKSPRPRGITTSTVHFDIPVNFSLNTLEEEVSFVLKLFPQIAVENFDTSDNTYKIAITGSWCCSEVIHLIVRFQPGYPVQKQIIIDIKNEFKNKNLILKNLQSISTQCAAKSTPSLESCLRYLIAGEISVRNNSDEIKHIPEDPVLKSLNHTLMSTTSEYSSSSIRSFQVDDHNPGHVYATDSATEDEAHQFTSDDSSDIEGSSMFGFGFHNRVSKKIVTNESRHSSQQHGSYPTGPSGGLSGFVYGLGLRNRASGERRFLGDVIVGKEFSNVPFPRLCGATFNATGQLVMFFSKLPHPSSTEFIAMTLTTRNQQPVLQPHQFNFMPKSFPLYESYRRFVISSMRRTLSASLPASLSTEVRDNSVDDGGGGSHSHSGSAPTGSFGSRGELDWLDDEDDEYEHKDSQNFYWKTKSGATFPSELSPNDYLAQIQRQSAANPHTFPKARYVNSRPTAHTPPNESLVIMDTHSSSDSDSGTKPIPYTTPFRTAASSYSERPSFLGTSLSKLHSASPGRRRYHTSFDDVLHSPTIAKIQAEAFSNISSSGSGSGSGSGGVVSEDSENMVEEAALYRDQKVYVLDLSEIHPVSRELAMQYSVLGVDPVKVCEANRHVAESAARTDLAFIWQLAELILTRNTPITVTGLATPMSAAPPKMQYDEMRAKYRTLRSKGKLSVSGEVVVIEESQTRPDWGWHPFGKHLVHELFQHLEIVGDFQTLALLLCVFVEPFAKTNKIKVDVNIKPENSVTLHTRPRSESRPAGVIFDLAVYFGYDRTTTDSSDPDPSPFPIKSKLKLITLAPQFKTEHPTPASTNSLPPSPMSESRDTVKVMPVLRPSLRERYNLIRMCYADMLLAW
ncbi:GATOR complex protein wdr59, partial [Nowakowskiella sp. JEL0078]